MSNWVTQGGWSFSTDRIHRNSDVGVKELFYRADTEMVFDMNVSYIYQIRVVGMNMYNHDSNLSFFTKWDSGYIINNGIDDSELQMENVTTNIGYLYVIAFNEISTTSLDYLKISATDKYRGSSGVPQSDPSQGQGILEIRMFDNDFKINGYSWVTTINTPSIIFSQAQLTWCPGWIYSPTANRFRWFDISPISTNPLSPRGGSNNISNQAYRNNNFIAKYIKYSFFNLSFQYDKSNTTNSDNANGIKIYLSPNTPPIGTNEILFNEYLINSANLISTINIIGATGIGFFGLRGNQYLIIVGEKASDNKSNNIILSDIEITGGYNDSNNQKFILPIPNFNNPNILGATYTSYIGNGNTLEPETLESISVINSKIGNGSFKSGLWENGVWNNGWRDDNNIWEFYDIVSSIRTLSNIKWSITIVGINSSITAFNVGDKVSISNIIGIDTNNKRKILRSCYVVTSVQPSSIDNRRGTISIEIQVTSPLMRIQRDSENHRIYVTKNVWLSGVFLNGYFTGVWNYGLVKGYPLITKLDNVGWIDGVYDGGHFRGENYIFGSFSKTTFNNGNLGLSFSIPHNLNIGDMITINKDNKNVNSFYDGDSTIIATPTDYEVILDKPYGITVENESGSYTTIYSTSLIQNIDFNSGNISNITSVQTIDSEQVFIYNSWMDLVYYTHSAVNIGKPQTQINEISRKSYSENNLYGYPTLDILSSNSTFRDSFSNTQRTYKLGHNYEIYNDYIGNSSKFTDYFGPTGSDLQLFLEQGWTFSIDDNIVNLNETTYPPQTSIDRTESIDNRFAGDELNVISTNRGFILDLATPSIIVPNRFLENIPREAYTMVEFDLINYQMNDIFSLGDSLTDGRPYYYPLNLIDNSVNIKVTLDILEIIDAGGDLDTQVCEESPCIDCESELNCLGIGLGWTKISHEFRVYAPGFGTDIRTTTFVRAVKNTPCIDDEPTPPLGYGWILINDDCAGSGESTYARGFNSIYNPENSTYETLVSQNILYDEWDIIWYSFPIILTNDFSGDNYNSGGNYNIISGVYTVPTNGIYDILLEFNVSSDFPSNNTFFISINKFDEIIARQDITISGYSSVQYTGNLNFGDKITIWFNIFNPSSGSLPDITDLTLTINALNQEGESSFSNFNIESNKEPIIHFNNINKISRNILRGNVTTTNKINASFLPIFENINHVLTNKKNKIEYFFNKTNLSMNIMGSGILGLYQSDVVINNLKIYEVDMIPFFKYFNYENINIGIQIPLQGIAPYIDFSSQTDTTFFDNITIGLDTININLASINDIFTGGGVGIGGVTPNFGISDDVIIGDRDGG